MWGLVEERAAATPNAPMLVDAADRAVTYGEFKDWAERAAAGLHALGVREGTPVTWQLPSWIETVVVSAALARLGATQNPILHIYREREVGFALRQTQPALFICPGEWKGFDFAAMGRSIAQNMNPGPEIVVVDGSLPEGDPSSLPPPPESGDAIRWIYYTSGTTSDPKGVQHSDQTLLAGGRGLAVALDMSPDDVGSIAFPFAHIAGPDYLVAMLLTGFSAVIVDAFVPADAVAVYSRHGVTMAGGSTAFYQAFLTEQRKQPGEKIIPTLRLLSGGGAAKPPEIFHEVVREIGVKVAHGYGMTEVPMISQGSPHDSDDQLINSEGKPVVGAEVRIVTADGDVAPAGVDGEVRIKGPMVCKGYTDPALTAEAFDAEGYFRTGDIGHLRPDGHLTLTGRLKDVIIRKGENISAREVEDLLYEHPKVADVAVIGLPDRERGERVCAVVEQASGEGRLELGEMVDYLKNAGLMVQKIPEQLEVVDALPRNETLRKVLKYKLREEYAAKPWKS
jgi:acyl-coenzyme A synthetase/AMP-(fatty) acid ligase